jgi:hypothetical protein
VRTRSNRFNDADDLTGLAGWMYTDLLLALMVIFLATISFVPQIYGTITSSSSTIANDEPAYSYSQYYEKPLVRVYSSFDINLIKQDIVNFLNAEKLPVTSFVGSIQIVGGYDPLREDSTIGINRAVEFSSLIDKTDPTLLAQSSTILSSATSIGANQVALKFTFIADINVKN